MGETQFDRGAILASHSNGGKTHGYDQHDRYVPVIHLGLANVSAHPPKAPSAGPKVAVPRFVLLSSDRPSSSTCLEP